MFPCHAAADAENFNCLFCYCPLYTLGEQCGGDFMYTANGLKDCSHCVLPHDPDKYGTITERLRDITAKMANHIQATPQ
jgi:Zn-finger protein